MQRFEPETAALYTAMALAALVHLHGKRIAHRDLKPENLVLTSDGYLMLVDYGLARPLGMGAERAWTLCGTPEYTAPEVIRGTGHGEPSRAACRERWWVCRERWVVST